MSSAVCPSADAFLDIEDESKCEALQGVDGWTYGIPLSSSMVTDRPVANKKASVSDHFLRNVALMLGTTFLS